MRTSIFQIVAVSSLVALAAAQWPSVAPAAGQSVRVVGGQSPATKRGDLWYSNNLATEAPLPDGYLAPSPQDAIDIKTYGSYRRASFDSKNLFMKAVMGQSRAFWTLFDHIKGRNIPMTAPVEFDFRNADNSRKFLGDVDWTMSFLYKSPSQGAAGDAGSNVWVADTTETTYISIGQEGGFSYSLLNLGVDRLRNALKSQTKWVAAGEPRFLGYNSPMVWYKWSEIQIPIKLASA